MEVLGLRVTEMFHRRVVRVSQSRTRRSAAERAAKFSCFLHNKAPSEPFSLFFTLDSFLVILLLAQCTYVKPFNTKDLNGLTSVHLQNSRLLDNLLSDQKLRQWHSRGLMYGKQWERGDDHLLAKARS